MSVGGWVRHETIRVSRKKFRSHARVSKVDRKSRSGVAAVFITGAGAAADDVGWRHLTIP